MDIRFVSSLTSDDENRIAPSLLTAIVQLLDMLPIACAIRIETTSGRIFQNSHPGEAESTVEVYPDVAVQT